MAKAAGVIVAVLVLIFVSMRGDQKLGLPELLGVAAVWGFLMWGAVALAAWLIEGFTKK